MAAHLGRGDKLGSYQNIFAAEKHTNKNYRAFVRNRLFDIRTIQMDIRAYGRSYLFYHWRTFSISKIYYMDLRVRGTYCRLQLSKKRAFGVKFTPFFIPCILPQCRTPPQKRPYRLQQDYRACNSCRIIYSPQVL